MDIKTQIESITNQSIANIEQLGGGCVSQVYRVTLRNNQMIIAKIDEGPNSPLESEGGMLQYLARNSALPVPEVFHVSKTILLMSYVEGESRFANKAQEHAAELLASLHQISSPTHGFERQTVIGGLPQPNPKTESWLTFFRDHRLLYMAEEGLKSKRLPDSLFQRLTVFCDHLDNWLEEPEKPSLIHGDVWTTNVLAKDERIVGFIDPAIYYADPEIELAFTTLFGTFKEPFFKRYGDIRPIKDGFFEVRRDIYNLYPLLVHVRLFGGSYVQSVSSILNHLGY